MFQELMHPLTAFMIFILVAIGIVLSAKYLKLPKTVAKLLAIIPLAFLIISLGGAAEVLSVGVSGAGDDIPDWWQDGEWELTISQDVTAVNWEDTIVADVDLWDATEGSVSDDQKKATVYIQYLYSSGAAIVPDELLVDVNVLNINMDLPPGITACDNGCWPLVVEFGSVVYIYNSTDGNTLPVVDMTTDYTWNMYVDDKADNPQRMEEHDPLNVGQWQPGESDTIRLGIKMEPAPFGAGGVEAYDSWTMPISVGGQTITVEFLVILVQ